MYESIEKNIQIVESTHGLYRLKVISHEGSDSILLTLEELQDLKTFLNDVPLPKKEKE